MEREVETTAISFERQKVSSALIRLFRFPSSRLQRHNRVRVILSHKDWMECRVVMMPAERPLCYLISWHNACSVITIVIYFCFFF
jgi:hypothetical protein